jgi:hypothetical protein
LQELSRIVKIGLWRKPDFIHLFVDGKKYGGDPLLSPRGVAA